MTGQAQLRNSQLVDNLRADYQPRHEPNFAWKGQAGLYQGLPALRAYYPLGAHYVTAQSYYATDVANDYDCLASSDPQFGYDDLIQYARFDGTNDCFYHADNAQFNITGLEGSTGVAQRGLTLGVWFRAASSGTERTIITKTNIQYWLFTSTTRNIKWGISSTGNWGGWQQIVSTNQWDVDVWHFAVGRFSPSNTLDVFLDNVLTSAPTANAQIGVTANPLILGMYFLPNIGVWDGDLSNAFICASALSDSIIEAIWQQTRAMYRR